MPRQLRLVQRLRRARIGQPRRQRRFVLGVQPRGVDVDAFAAGRHDRHRGRVGVEGLVRARDGHAEAAAVAVLGEPGRQGARLEQSAADVETELDLRLHGRQGVEQPVPQDPELQVVEQLVDAVAVPRLHPQGLRGVCQRHVPDQVRQLTVEDDAGEVGPQRVADLAFDLIDMVDQRL